MAFTMIVRKLVQQKQTMRSLHDAKQQERRDDLVIIIIIIIIIINYYYIIIIIIICQKEKEAEYRKSCADLNERKSSTRSRNSNSLRDKETEAPVETLCCCASDLVLSEAQKHSMKVSWTKLTGSKINNTKHGRYLEPKLPFSVWFILNTNTIIFTSVVYI